MSDNNVSTNTAKSKSDFKTVAKKVGKGIKNNKSTLVKYGA
jgi:hypothetical protein